MFKKGPIDGLTFKFHIGEDKLCIVVELDVKVAS